MSGTAFEACSSSSTPSTSPDGGTDATTATASVCGATCDEANPCVGAAVTCLPAAAGGSVCKPSACNCTDGKFCAYDKATCTVVGCTSEACGYPYTGDCDDCVKANCCAQSKTCKDDVACDTLFTCISMCTNYQAACVAACEQSASASAIAEFNAIGTCNKASCSAECFAPTCPAATPVLCSNQTACCDSAHPNCCTSASGEMSCSTSPTCGAGGDSLPNGCSTADPVACGDNLCCPSEYPVCHGTCGQNCCAETTTSVPPPPQPGGSCNDCSGVCCEDASNCCDDTACDDSCTTTTSCTDCTDQCCEDVSDCCPDTDCDDSCASTEPDAGEP